LRGKAGNRKTGKSGTNNNQKLDIEKCPSGKVRLAKQIGQGSVKE
jgi:hypothetical protein